MTLVTPAFAAGGQTGNINGSVIDGATKAPIANATVTIVSPTSRYTAKTDARGFFQINGLNVDTYNVTVTAAGYDPSTTNGVTVQGDQTISLGSAGLSKRLATIGTTRGRSQSSIFQPNQTTDQTTITGTRAVIAAGKTASTNENDLALSVPGVQLDNAGALTIRGGLISEVGYQLDGISFTDPFLARNNNAGFDNGVGSLQVVAGNGDASQGNVGSGVVNVIPKRGTNPPFGQVDLEAGGPNYDKQFNFEYGFASPNGRISEYVAYNGQRQAPYFGFSNTDAASYGNVDQVSFQKNDDLLSNTVFKFGKNQNQSIKVLYETRDLQQNGDLSGLPGRVPFYNNPYFFQGLAGGNYSQDLISGLLTPLPNQPTGSGSPTSAELLNYQPTRFLEFEYDNSLNASTFLQLKTYNLESLHGGTNYYPDNTSGFGNGFYQVTGGNNSGVKLDITKTLNASNTLSFGVQNENRHPIWNGIFGGDSAFFFSQFGQAQPGPQGPTTPYGTIPSINDFLTPSNIGANPGLAPGYLYSVLGANTPTTIPSFAINYNQTDFQIFSVYLRDQIQIGSKLKLDLGLREDAENWKQGANPYATSLSNPDDVPVGGNTLVGVGDNYLRDQVVHPKILQPRAAFSYQLGPNDAISGSYGVSTIFPNAQTLGTPGSLYNVPSVLNTVGPLPGTNTANPATWTCGSGYNAAYLVPGGANASGSGGSFFRCTSYAQQVYWLFDQNLDAPDAGNNIPPIEVDKDFTYSHLFKNGTGMKVTAYYDRGFSVPEESIISQILNAQGIPISQVFGVTNTGTKKVSGGELGFTTRVMPYGFTGFLSATYTNILNTVPPLVAGEDLLPLVPKASIALGDLYRAGYVSPFVIRAGAQYKLHNGFRINPVVSYDRGFPTGVGNIIATQIPGGFANLPQTNINAPTYSGFTGITGSYNATNYVDPTDPGTLSHPNIAATRGTPETSSAGGYLTRPRLNTNITLEYTHNRSTFGGEVLNVFGNVYGEPLLNPYYQPVATGVGGPATATTANAALGSATYIYGGFRNIPNDAYGQSPYIELPTRPLTFRLYYQLAL